MTRQTVRRPETRCIVIMELKEDLLVLAKLRGYPWWPGIVTST